jgi:serine-type D-Ala-D-Ala carboxypeptidase (penicillin-binding protein 5/6)
VTQVSVLQGGRGRRRHPPRRPRARRERRRGHAALVLLATVALAVTALLVFMASRAGDPKQALIALRHQPAVRHRAAAAPPKPSVYATQPAPAGQLVQLKKLKQGLRSGILFDLRTGRVLWARNPGQLMAIASLTKMMTALLVVARTRPADTAMITPEAVHFSGSGVGELPLGKHVSVLALLYGLLLPSGNDAAIALAQHVGGSERHFVAMMNAQARQMGLTCTHFSSASGLVDQDNYSCTKDLAALAHAVLEQPVLARIVASRSAALPFPIKGGKLFLYNNNPLLLSRYPGADGVKTGYTQASGQCLVATAKRGRAWIGVVLLRSGDAPDQAQQLLDAGFRKIGV